MEKVEASEKKKRWIRFSLPPELREMFQRAYDLDPEARSFAHFAQLALQERTERILNANEHKRLYGRVQTESIEGEEE